jgi:hemerythrin-like metal-binding protein
MLLWSEQFATGHPTIDEQHRTLFDNINRLEGLLVQTNPSRAEVDFMLDLIGYLEGYVVQHFQLEEQCMESHRCPVFQQNKDAHRQFVAFFQRFRERCQAEGFRQELLHHLHQTIHDWIQQHIMRIDVQLKPCLASTPPA